jgi:hypothetical protein
MAVNDYASGWDPRNSACAVRELAQGGSVRIELAANGSRLFNTDMNMVPSLDQAIGKCQWYANG